MTNLETGMAYRLALIIGPQGNGKTALLRQWAAWRSSSAQSHPCWANLTEEDNRLAHFLTHLAWALAGLDAQPDGLMRAASRVSGPGMNSGAKAALHPL